MLPTTPPGLTAQGTIGTFQDMAPEQLEGQEADARTDIFAFGAALYEMLTGKKAFEGKSHASLISAIMSSDPKPVSALQPLTPPALDRIVGTCLAKDPDDRYQSARDLLRDLTWVASGASDDAAARTVTPSARSNRVPWLVAAVSTIALIATAVIALRRAGEVAPAAGPVQFTIAPPENTSFGGPVVEVPASPHRWRCLPMAGTSCSSPAPNPRTRSGCDRSPPWPHGRFREPKAGPSRSGRLTAGSSGSSRAAS